MHLYGYDFLEWKQAVFPDWSLAVFPDTTLIIAAIDLYTAALKYDLPELADAALLNFGNMLDNLFKDRRIWVSQRRLRTIAGAAVHLYNVSGSSSSSLLDRMHRVMRRNWPNLMAVHKEAIRVAFDECPRLATDLLLTEGVHIRWSTQLT